MNTKTIVQKWFDCWENGDYASIPVSENFIHESPFGVINGKQNYLSIVEANLDKFLGHRFEIIDSMYDGNVACVRYQSKKASQIMDVSEWYYFNEGVIAKIVAYYDKV